MQQRRRFIQVLSLKERLALFSEEIRKRADQLPAGDEQVELMRRARRAEVASHLDDWANSSGLQQPK